MILSLKKIFLALALSTPRRPPPLKNGSLHKINSMDVSDDFKLKKIIFLDFRVLFVAVFFIIGVGARIFGPSR